MEKRNLLNAGLLLGLADLAILGAYRNSMHILLAGLFYLAVANVLCILGVSLVMVSRAQIGTTFRQTTSLSLKIRAQMLLLIAWQIAIVGMLNITTTDLSRLHIPFWLNYLLFGIFFFGSLRLVSISDSSDQDGGYVPLNYFGRPRTRRLLFVLFTVLCVLIPLVGASIEFASDGGRRPTAFQHPQLCLLMAAITSVMSAGFLLERYRKAESTKTEGAKVFSVTLCVLAVAAIMQSVFSYGVYVYVLSAFALVGSAIAVLCLWKVGESVQDGFRSPRAGSSSVESPVRP
jgi:hypothetical protein